MLLDSIIQGAPLFLTFEVLGLTLVGLLFGLFVGVLPGLGPLMGIILLMPFAISLPPISAMALLIGIFVGGSCGGSVSAILLRIPGTPLAAATLFDGYPMAQKGQADKAIGISISSSAIGGLLGGVVLITLAPLLATVAAGFGPPEYAALAVTGLVSIVVVSDGSVVKAILSGLIGLLLATIGTDEFSTGFRFTFGNYNLLNGFDIVAVVVGLFALSEMFLQTFGNNMLDKPNLPHVKISFSSLLITLKHWKNLVRSSAIGVFFGALPGAGGVISSFAAYAIAKASAKPDEPYGEGAEGGIVATESANNATVGGTFIPTLALAIPGDATTAIFISALLILGIFPGPTLFDQRPDIVGGIFLVYFSANILLVFFGIITTPLFVHSLRLKKAHLIPIILLLCGIGTYALQASVFDLWSMLGFGILGTLFRFANYPLSPVVIGLVLGPFLENNLRRSLLISRDGLWIFVDRPVSAILVTINVALILWAFYSFVIRKPKQKEQI